VENLLLHMRSRGVAPDESPSVNNVGL
jgi:hypothetical protein